MKTKKIRGHNRIWKDIEKWKNANLKLDLENLKHRERDYVKIWVHPFSGISLTNSQNPEPRGETKERILNGLFDIYENWKNQLDELNEPYYLKIWLFESSFSKSQVVCAIGNSIDFYNTTFNSPENVEEFKTDFVGIKKKRIENFNWEHKLDEDFMFSTDIGNPEDYENEKEYLEDKKWFNDRLKKKHTRKTLNDGTETYAFELGKVWIGENKNVG
ncbi:hypothetical protein [Hanstruepera ponticola]|uniref:hypothetical protein n=1 Tax=Hanstruepera ponticola TaxID=2042995 RepID=UPI000CF0673E|nr:hypothetical protein [Hanstruepera ponticola]